MPDAPRVARAALHFWEEPVISGVRGAGTVFFSGCALRCVFCQNEDISQKNFGKTVSVHRLAEIFKELEGQGAHNIDLVNPTHYAHLLPQAIVESGVQIPFVWNSGGYDDPAVVKALAPYVSIWLPDWKYVTPEKASRYSGAADYPEAARRAIQAMVDTAGPYEIQGGVMTRGVLIRHLLLPGNLPEAKGVMDAVSELFPPKTVLFSLMGQYLPLGRAGEFPEIDRPVRKSELRSAAAYMDALGLEGFTQDAQAADAGYIPGFDLTGV